MKNIKGPKSALTDFIEESGIKITNLKPLKQELRDNTIININQKVKKRKKTLKFQKPTEIASIKPQNSDNLLFIQNALENIEEIEMDDNLIDTISSYVSKNRKMSLHYFQIFNKKATNKLSIYDCSMIKDSEYSINKNLSSLELFHCGQLSENTLNRILKDMKNLKCLRITGAYLLENFELPSTLKILDISNCSRIQDDFIDEINKTFISLDELRLSFCYGLRGNISLKTQVKKLFICETKLSENFFNMININEILALSVKNCSMINNLPFMPNLEYLDVEGVVSLEGFEFPSTLKHLNISYCIKTRKILLPNIKYLNMSHLNLKKEELMLLKENKTLEMLDISWNHELEDRDVEDLINNLNLKKLILFGCFGLSNKTAELAWELRGTKEIIGSPSETSYLLKNK